MPFASLRIVCLGLLLLAAPAAAQPANGPSAGLSDIVTAIDAVRPVLTAIETDLAKPTLTEAELQALRQRLLPVSERLRGTVDAVQPRIDAANERLEQLGPAPASGAPPESADAVRDRQERVKAVNEAVELQRRARAILVEADQLGAAITDRRRQVFAQTVFVRSQSIINPELWIAALDMLPGDLANLQAMATDWLDRARERYRDGRLWLLLVAAFGAAALAVVKRRLDPYWGRRRAEVSAPSSLHVATVAVARVVLGTLPVAIACFILYAAMDAIYLLPLRIGPLAMTILSGIAFLAFARALGDAVLAPGLPQWRLVKVDSPTAQILMRMIWVGSGLAVAAQITEALLTAAAGALPLTVLARGAFAVAFALSLIGTLRALARKPDEVDEECLGPFLPAESRFAAPLRLLGWIAGFAILIAALSGFIALSAFVVSQIVWVATLIGIVVILLAIIDNVLAASVAEDARVSLTLQQMVGVRRRSLEQVTVLASGTLRVIVIIVAILLALAPWGVESADVWSYLRAAFFGVKIGDFTISLSAVFSAAILFMIGLAITKAVQRWLDRRFLPSTEIEPGLQNSIQTVFGYLGVIIAGAIAFSQLGLSFDRLTIVAGALSVGIGFGLQSIVSNFVSGLILLGERPIRVGDRILVGADEGIVKRINVRATEIETGDRAILMVPNSTLITGVVRNRVRNDRTGRVLTTIVMPRTTDAAFIRSTLLGVALDHKDVLKQPPPAVMFKKIGETTLEFDLIAIVPDVEITGRVASDLNFEAYRRLGIGKIADAEPGGAVDEAPEPPEPPAEPADAAETLLAPQAKA